jgi:hypothetical protein
MTFRCKMLILIGSFVSATVSRRIRLFPFHGADRSSNLVRDAILEPNRERRANWIAPVAGARAHDRGLSAMMRNPGGAVGIAVSAAILGDRANCHFQFIASRLIAAACTGRSILAKVDVGRSMVANTV